MLQKREYEKILRKVLGNFVITSGFFSVFFSGYCVPFYMNVSFQYR